MRETAESSSPQAIYGVLDLLAVSSGEEYYRNAGLIHFVITPRTPSPRCDSCVVNSLNVF
jgi:hypothetical protein